MLDTGKALHPTGGWVWDAEQGKDVQATEPMFGPTRCKVQTRNLGARDVEVGGRTSTSVRTELHIPADSPPLAVGDLWEFTAVDPLSLATVGQRVRIVGPVAGTLKTAARYEVSETVT